MGNFKEWVVIILFFTLAFGILALGFYEIYVNSKIPDTIITQSITSSSFQECFKNGIKINCT